MLIAVIVMFNILKLIVKIMPNYPTIVAHLVIASRDIKKARKNCQENQWK
jgi:N-acetyl-anhydromuramyl-L-alanine amidase AmpD